MESFIKNVVLVSEKSKRTAIEKTIKNSPESVRFYKVAHTSDAFHILNRMHLDMGGIPALIFLDTDLPAASIKAFIKAMDRDYSGARKDKIILINDGDDIGSLIQYAISDYVQDIISTPLMDVETKPFLRKQTSSAKPMQTPRQERRAASL
jgi:hypothetical protein